MAKPRLSIACTVLICSLYSLAADRRATSFASLPAEAQEGIRAAMEKEIPIQNFTLTASDGSDKDYFGISVAIDGNTVAVGAPSHLGGIGEAYVFVKPSGGWKNMTETARLTASNGESPDHFGTSLSISGNTIVVGSPDATVNGNSAQGASYVFVEPSNGWRDMTETAELSASDGFVDAEFGSSVAISGNSILVGAPGAFVSSPGSAYIFVEPPQGWADMTQTAELTASDGTGGDYFGSAVSISGNTSVVGAFQPGQGSGAAYVFVAPQTGWVNATQTAELTPSDGIINDLFGTSVSIAGNTVAVGAPGSDAGTGAAYAYVEPTGGWSNMTQTAELSTSAASGLGSSVSVSGSAILAGAPQSNPNHRGAAYVFAKPNTGWKNTSKPTLTLSIPFKYQWDNFGIAVGLNGKTAIIGASSGPTSPPCNPFCAPGPGEAFIFTAQ